MLPEEITHASAEYSSGDAVEFLQLSDEFFQRSAPADPPKKKRKPIQLAAGVMAAAVVVNTFVGLPLAPIKAPTQPPYCEGYSVQGYVIDYSLAGSNLTNVGFNSGSQSFAVDVGFSLTSDEIQLVPVWEEDQIHHIYVHPIWIADEGTNNWENAPVVTLDGGDESVSLPIDLPLGSGGIFYVCATVPEREGYTFAGWYDEQVGFS